MDVYGFPLTLSPAEEGVRLRANEKQSQQVKKWDRYVKDGLLPGKAELKSLCRKGIPTDIRPRVWMAISGASKRQAENGKGYYTSMVALGEGSTGCRNQIELDLPRTFPENVWTTSAEGQNMLRRVLLAFSVHAPAIGYCQSMNFLTAMLLLVLAKDEEKSFWCLVSMLDGGCLYPDTFSHNLLGCHVEMQSLGELLSTKMPLLALHFARTTADISMIATDAFLCCFCTALPAETAMRVWDSLLLEGPKILYRVLLYLLKDSQQALLALDDAGLIMTHMKKAAARFHDRDHLMAGAFKGVGSMPMKQIQAIRGQKKPVLQFEFRKMESKRNLRQAIQQGTDMKYVSRDGLISEADKIKRDYESGAKIIWNLEGNSGGSGADGPGVAPFLLGVRDVTHSSRGQLVGSIALGKRQQRDVVGQ